MSFAPGGIDLLNSPNGNGGALRVHSNGSPTGAVNTAVGAASFAFRITREPNDEGFAYDLIASDGVQLKFALTINDDIDSYAPFDTVMEIRLGGRETSGMNSGDIVLFFGIPNEINPGDGECHHFQCSWDTAHASLSKVYSAAFDGVAMTAVEPGGPYDPFNNSFVLESEDWGNIYVNADGIASIAEFYAQTTSYIDFTSQANINKFWSADTGFTDLGADGSTPTASQPIIYLSVRNGSADEFLVNRGYGGDFVVEDGPVAVREFFCGEPPEPEPTASTSGGGWQPPFRWPRTPKPARLGIGKAEMAEHLEHLGRIESTARQIGARLWSDSTVEEIEEEIEGSEELETLLDSFSADNDARESLRNLLSRSIADLILRMREE